MPISVQHAILYVTVFVLLVSLLLSTIYVVISNMLIDAYGYEKILEKANEKLKVGGVLYEEFYYAVRNLGLTSVDLLEIGYIDSSGNRYILETSKKLKPGEIYKTSRASWTSTPIAVYVVTSRGNIFSGPVIRSDPTTGIGQIRIRSVLPTIHYLSSPVVYSNDAHYVISFNTNSYLFGFVLAKDLNSDNSVMLEFGPYNIASLFKSCSVTPNCQASFVDSKSGSIGTVSLSAKYIFSVEQSGGNPYIKITMPLSATNSVQGIFVRGCIGIGWRVLSNTFFSYAIEQGLSRGWSHTSLGNLYYADNINVYLFPSSVNIDNIRAILSNLGGGSGSGPQYAEPPSGSIVEVYLVRCFTVSSRSLQSISFSPDNSPQSLLPGGYIIWSELVFPGTNNMYGGSFTINDIPLQVYLNTEMVLEALLAS
ncbi:MAG: hypothetical protein QW611_03400 [Ignisphaera sp.]